MLRRNACAVPVFVTARAMSASQVPISQESVNVPQVLRKEYRMQAPSASVFPYSPMVFFLDLYRTSVLSSGKPFVLWRRDTSRSGRVQCAAPGPKKSEEGAAKQTSPKEVKDVKKDVRKPAGDGLFNGIWGGKKTDKNGGGGNNDDEDGDDKAGSRQGDQVLKHYFFGTVFLLGLTFGFYWLASPGGPNVTWAEAAEWSDKIVKIQLYENYVQFYLESGDVAHIGLTNSTQRTDMLIKTLTKLSSDVPITYVGGTYSETVLIGLGTVLWLLPVLFFPVYSAGMARLVGNAGAAGQQGAQSSKMSKKMFTVTKKTTTKFKDIAGMHEAKFEVKEVVDFLKNPEPYHKLGAKIPTGAMLLGPPGTGKTLLAKAVAGEAGVSFIPTNGSDFVELYVGMGALRVRELFALAKKQEGRVIIYIDEIDAIGLKRRGAGHGEKQEQEHTLNELLTQLDGFNSEENKVLILASSNVGQEMLDPALIRPGRFDRIVHVDAPVLSERKEIFGVHLANLKLVEPPVVKLPELEVVDDDGTELPEGLEAQVKASMEKHMQENPGAKINTVKVVKVSDINDGEAVAAAMKKAHAEAQIQVDAIKAATIATAKKAAEEEEASVAKKVDGAAKLEEAKKGNKAPMKMVETKAETTPDHTETGMDTKIIASTDSVLGTGKTEEAETVIETITKVEVEKTPQELYEEEKAALVTKFADRMSDLCPGFVGADISNICNEAAILAARENAPLVTIVHLEKSIDRVLAGIEMRSRVLSDFEKKVVAHHEAGHAIAGWYLNRADPLMKVSIVPRGGKALGYAQYLPSENNLKSGNDILDSMCVALGGRVAEVIYFNHLSTGASDDLMRVTRMAYQHAAAFSDTGMAYTPPMHAGYRKPYGDSVSDKLDVAAQKLVDQAYQRTFELLTARKEEMTKLSQHLLKHEVLTHQDVVDYLGLRDKRTSDFRVA